MYFRASLDLTAVSLSCSSGDYDVNTSSNINTEFGKTALQLWACYYKLKIQNSFIIVIIIIIIIINVDV